MNETSYKPGPASLFASHAREFPLDTYSDMECLCCGGYTKHKLIGENRDGHKEFYKCLRCNVIRTVRW